MLEVFTYVLCVFLVFVGVRFLLGGLADKEGARSLDKRDER